MVARTALDTIIALSWIGVLAVVLVVRAMLSWLSFRWATRSADQARRLAEATRPVSERAGGAVVVAFPRKERTPTSAADVNG